MRWQWLRESPRLLENAWLRETVSQCRAPIGGNHSPVPVSKWLYSTERLDWRITAYVSPYSYGGILVLFVFRFLLIKCRFSFMHTVKRRVITNRIPVHGVRLHVDTRGNYCRCNWFRRGAWKNRPLMRRAKKKNKNTGRYSTVKCASFRNSSDCPRPAPREAIGDNYKSPLYTVK